jgi:hypothetical protein
VSELRTIIVDARTAQEAQAAAVKWARAQPRMKLRTITRVRPTEGDDEWAVEIAYVVVPDQQEAGL